MDQLLLAESYSKCRHGPSAGRDGCLAAQQAFQSKVLLGNMRRLQAVDDAKYAQAKVEAARAVASDASPQDKAKAEAKAEKKRPSVVRQILWMNSRDLALDFVLTIVSYSLAYLSPFFLKQILQALQTVGTPQEASTSASSLHGLADISTVTMFTAMPPSYQDGARFSPWSVINLVASTADNGIDPAKKRAFLYAFFALVASRSRHKQICSTCTTVDAQVFASSLSSPWPSTTRPCDARICQD